MNRRFCRAVIEQTSSSRVLAHAQAEHRSTARTKRAHAILRQGPEVSVAMKSGFVRNAWRESGAQTNCDQFIEQTPRAFVMGLRERFAR